MRKDLRYEFEESALLVGSGQKIPDNAVATDLLRMAIHTERKLRIAYGRPLGIVFHRVVWPFALVYFDHHAC